jgi:hypothetical protein
VQALADGDRRLAAFYAGGLAHYMGDLGQFYHIMGSQSHWGSEDRSRDSAFESTLRFQNRTSRRVMCPRVGQTMEQPQRCRNPYMLTDVFAGGTSSAVCRRIIVQNRHESR